MVLVLALAPERPVEGDVLGRPMLGWPSSGGRPESVESVGLRGRGPWHLDAERAFAEPLAFAVDAGSGLVGAVILVTGFARYLNCRRLVEGPVIVDHPAVGQLLPDPLPDPGRAGYAPDPFSPPDFVEVLKEFWTLGAVVPDGDTTSIDELARAVDDVRAELAALASSQ